MHQPFLYIYVRVLLLSPKRVLSELDQRVAASPVQVEHGERESVQFVKAKRSTMLDKGMILNHPTVCD